MSPSPLIIHQLILGEFYDALKTYVKQQENQGLIVLPPMDIRLDANNIYQPDLIYIAKDRIAEIVKDRIEGAPDLVLEILSPSTAYYDLRQKKNIYEKYGVKEYIVVDPTEQSAELYVLKDGIYQMHQKTQNNEQLSSVLLQGFSIDLSKLFQ